MIPLDTILMRIGKALPGRLGTWFLARALRMQRRQLERRIRQAGWDPHGVYPPGTKAYDAVHYMQTSAKALEEAGIDY